MKKEFFDEVIKVMVKNEDIYFISIGLGWPRTDELKDKFPGRYVQTEASEQTALDIAVGLAYSHKIPIVYSITPFLLYRGFETIRTYIDHERLHVILAGAGRDDDYKDDGFSHDASDVYTLFDTKLPSNFPNITALWPETKEEIPKMVQSMVEDDRAWFISLRR